jgi:hypothetical protein
MKLTLDHTQRLNLHALLGAQRADVGSIRTIWAVQDKIALDADEEKALELKRALVGGQERVVWNADFSLPVKELELSEPEVGTSGVPSKPGNLTLPVLIADGCSRLSMRCFRLTSGPDHTWNGPRQSFIACQYSVPRERRRGYRANLRSTVANIALPRPPGNTKTVWGAGSISVSNLLGSAPASCSAFVHDRPRPPASSKRPEDD